MADITFLRNEDMEDMADMEDTDEPMEGADDEKTGGDGPADGRGDEGGGESVSPITKLQQHASCNMSFNRQLVGRILVEVFRGAVETGTELNVDEVMQPVLTLVNDTDAVVRIDLVEQLPHVAMICQEAPDRLGDVLPRHLIQIIGTFLHDVDQQVRQSTHAALLALIERGLLDKNSAEHVVAPALLRMSEQLEKLELFTIAIDGMSKVVRVLDEETAERLFLNRYLELCMEENFFIRRLCAIRLGKFSAAMGKDAVYEKLLPMYISLCKDPVWSVRKSCADVIVSFACCVSLHHRRTTLSELLANLLNDDSKWVKVSAFQILGPFISTFAKQFTGFSYNQYGELVLTDQHGTELRYNVSSFAGSAEPSPCKTVITSGQVVNFYDENGTKDNDETMDNRAETNKENVPLKDRRGTEWRSTREMNDDNHEKDATITHDYDQFNPFRYYYIPPDLPLDTELVQAAIIEKTEKSMDSRMKDEKESTADLESETIPVDCESRREQGENRTENQPIEPYTARDSCKRSELAFEIENMDEKENTNETGKNDGDSRRVLYKKKSFESSECRRIRHESYNDNQPPIELEKMSFTFDMSEVNFEIENTTTDGTKEKKNETAGEIVQLYMKFTDFSKKDHREVTTKNEISEETKKNNETSNNASWPSIVDLLNDAVDIENCSADPADSDEKNEKIDHSADSGQTIVPHVLVNFFISMADLGANNLGPEIPRHCAFSFPAVVLTLGRENWPLLKKAYTKLADAREYKVRRTMASSIHELALILGEKLTARDLLPIYDGFIKDLDEVRIGALKNLTTFLKVLRPEDRKLFLPRLKAFLKMDNEWNWRFREEVANRLLEAIPLFSPKDVSDHIAPLLFPLLVDKVAAVRHTALDLATQIISYLSTNEKLVTSLVKDLKYLLTSKPSKWTCRQTFALLCSSLISNKAISPEKFGTDLLPCLLSLATDVVPNVRLAVATALSRHVVNIFDHLDVGQAASVNRNLIEMITDPDRDVRIVVGGTAGKYRPLGAERKTPVVKSKFSW